MSELEPSGERGGVAAERSVPPSAITLGRGASPQVGFSRHEFDCMFNLYGRKVSAGEWRDYAIDFLKDRAVFSVFRRSTEGALYRIEKIPAVKQGDYRVVSATGLIIQRGHDLARVLRALEPPLRLVIAN